MTAAIVPWALSRVVVGAAAGLRGWNVVGCFSQVVLCTSRVAVTTAQRGLTTANSGSRAVQIWVAHPREF